FAKAMSQLSVSGRIVAKNGTVVLTDEGRALAQPVDAPMTTEALQERVMGFVSGPGQKMLRALIACYPRSMARQDLARAANYEHLNSSGFVKAMSRLRTLGFIDYPSGGQV